VQGKKKKTTKIQENIKKKRKRTCKGGDWAKTGKPEISTAETKRENAVLYESPENASKGTKKEKAKGKEIIHSSTRAVKGSDTHRRSVGKGNRCEQKGAMKFEVKRGGDVAWKRSPRKTMPAEKKNDQSRLAQEDPKSAKKCLGGYGTTGGAWNHEEKVP